MPQNDSEATLLVQYTESSATYSYAQLSLINNLTDQSQIEVRWDVDTVYSLADNQGVAFSVEDLSDNAQATIKTLVPDVQYTIDAEAKTITLNTGSIANAEVTVESGTTYFYPNTVTISGSQNLQIRRATDITSQLVVFQPGSRLTAENLNLSSAQLFNALQELTAFGVSAGGIVSGVDLTNSSITDLSDVTLNTNGILSWNGSVVTAGADAGSLVPSTAGFSPTDDGKAVLYVNPNTGNDTAWEFVTYDDVRDGKAGTNKLSTKLSTLDSSISTLQNKTQNITQPTNPGPTVLANGATITAGGIGITSGDLTVSSGDVTVSSGGLEVTTGDIDILSGELNIPIGNVVVTAGDVTIQGTSVHDYITNQPYFVTINSGDSATKTPSTTSIIETIVGKTSDYSSTSIGGTGSSDFSTATGQWTAPRDMTLVTSLSWFISNDGPVLSYASTGEYRSEARGYGLVFKGSSAQGVKAYSYRAEWDDIYQDRPDPTSDRLINLSEAIQTVSYFNTISVQAGDVLTFRLTLPAFNSDLRAKVVFNDVYATITEVR